MNNLFRNALPFILILSVMILNTSCDKEEKGEQPELPPVESMVMDFSDFQESPGDIVKGEKVAITTYTNFNYAYQTVSFWNAFTAISLLVPVSSYSYALQQEPVYLGNNKWEWSYNFMIEQEEFTATLKGERLDNERFSMVMNIAYADLPLLKLKYFDGICRYDHTAAEWNLYKFDDASSIKTLEIEWTKNYETGDASLKYTYVEPGQTETNSSITWIIDPDGTYNAGYYIVLSTGNVDIEWDTKTKAGHVRSPYYFEDSDWHCWNDLLQDIVCAVK
jgi:hypothetical protein